MRTFSFLPLPLLCLALFSPLSTVQADNAKAESVTRKLKGERLNELGLWDLGSDGIYEVFTTAISGNAGCYRADTLEPLWSRSYATQALTAPVIGNFLGTGAPVLAFASSTGDIFFVWPGSGEIIATQKSSYTFSLAPSVATFVAENKDALVLPDDSGQVILFDLTSDGKARERAVIPNSVPDATAFSIIGRIIHPASCADINNDGVPEVVVTSNSGVVQIISFTEPPTRSFARLAQQTQASTIAGIGSLTQPDAANIIIGVDASLYIYKWELGKPSIDLVLQTPAFGKSLGHFVLAPLNGDATPDLISSADNVVAARYMGKDINGKEMLLDVAASHMTTINPSFSPAFPLLTPDNTTAIISIDGKGSVIEWQPATQANSTREIANIAPPTGFTPAGCLVPGGKPRMIIWDEKSSTLSSVPLAAEASPQSPPALTLGINYSRNGQWGAEWSHEWQAKLQKAAEVLKTAQSGLQADTKDTDSALDAASIVRGLAPLDAYSQKSAHSNRKSSATIWIVSILLSLVVIGTIAFLLLKMKARARR